MNPANTTVKRSKRLAEKKQKNYKNLSTGSHLKLTEGTTEVSKHVAEKTNEGDPCRIKIDPITHESNWDRRLYKEAIEIKRRKPTLNEDLGKRKIPAIYSLLPKEQTESQIERLSHGNTTADKAPNSEEDILQQQQSSTSLKKIVEEAR